MGEQGRRREGVKTSRAEGWEDLTIFRGVEIENWKVESEETLSDHKYITYKIKSAPKQRRSIQYYVLVNRFVSVCVFCNIQKT